MQPTASGVLAKTPLAHLVVYCAEKKLRGALVLRPEGDNVAAHADVITLVDGMPAKIRVADPIEHLGRILVELGAIDDAAYNESLMALGRGEGLQGQLLLAAGKIDAATLERAMRLQIARKLGHLFGRPLSTTYAYYEGADFLGRYGGPELFPVDPSAIVFTGVRAAPSQPHLEATLEKMAGAPLRLRSGADLKAYDLTRGERDLLDLLKMSSMTIDQLVQSGVADARTARVLVYGLLLLKQIEPAVVQAAPSSAPAAVAAVKVALKRMPTGASTIVETGGGDGREENAPPSSRRRVAPVAAPDDPRRTEIQTRAASIAKEDYFHILGIAKGAEAEEAKNAYFQLAKRWHPDRLPAELADLRDDCAKVFTLMAEAYQTLSDADRRTRYLEVLNTGGGTPEDQAEVARVMEAANSFQKAEFFTQKGQLTEAEPYAARAFELEPAEPDYVAVWCWIEANKPERRELGKYDDLLAKLDKTLADAPACERARYFRGMILKTSGRMGDAIRDFREVVEKNPRHVDATREVRLYNMRQDRDRKTKDDGSGSLLGRFMKKK
jgi:curved DNA-binding protein CbpA